MPWFPNSHSRLVRGVYQRRSHDSVHRWLIRLAELFSGTRILAMARKKDRTNLFKSVVPLSSSRQWISVKNSVRWEGLLIVIWINEVVDEINAVLSCHQVAFGRGETIKEELFLKIFWCDSTQGPYPWLYYSTSKTKYFCWQTELYISQAPKKFCWLNNYFVLRT